MSSIDAVQACQRSKVGIRLKVITHMRSTSIPFHTELHMVVRYSYHKRDPTLMKKTLLVVHLFTLYHNLVTSRKCGSHKIAVTDVSQWGRASHSINIYVKYVVYVYRGMSIRPKVHYSEDLLYRKSSSG